MAAGQQALSAVRARPRATLLRASLLLLAVAAVSKLTTVAADSFVAARFGLSADADAYLLAIGLIGALVGAPSETLRLALVPVCGRFLREGATRRAAGVITVVVIAVGGLGVAASVGLAAGAPWVARVAAPGFEGASFDLLVRLTRVLSVALCIGLVTSVVLGALHARLRFGAPALVGIGLSAGVVAGGVLLGGTLGVTALAAGYVAGTVAVLAVLVWLVRDLFREGAALAGARQELAPFLRLALPTGLAISIVSAGAVIERGVASATGAGSVAALGFAIKLVTQAGIVSQSIWTPLTPLLTASGASARDEGDRVLVAFSLKLVLLILVPATALLIALREPLVAVIFQRGAFTASDTRRTATLLALHSGSLVGEGLFMVAVAALLSFYDTATRLIASGLLIVCKVALMLALAPVAGVAGIAIAASASSLLAGGYSVAVLGRRFPEGQMRELAAFCAKITAAALLAFTAAAALAALPPSWAGGSAFAGALGRLAIGGAGGAAVYLAALPLLRVEEAETLLARARARWSAGG
jgi:putative peptidoglycan lipid II flippase